MTHPLYSCSVSRNAIEMPPHPSSCTYAHDGTHTFIYPVSGRSAGTAGGGCFGAVRFDTAKLRLHQRATTGRFSTGMHQQFTGFCWCVCRACSRSRYHSDLLFLPQPHCHTVLFQVGAHGTGARIPPVDEQVVAMKLVTPNLGTIELSDHQNPGLFRMAKVTRGVRR